MFKRLVPLWLALFALTLVLYVLWNEPLRRVALNLIPLLISLGFVLSLCGIGMPLSRWLIREQEKWIQALTSLAFGVGLTGVLNFSLGLFGFFDPTFFLLWTTFGLILFAFAFVRWWRPEKIHVIHTGWSVLAFAILAAFLIQDIPFVVAPEASTDSLAYHLLIPKLYLTAGKVYHLTLFVEACYPSLVEYNYLSILRLTDEIVCKCWHFWIGIAVLILIGRMIRKAAPQSNNLLGPALFVTMPVASIHIGWAWNDFLYTLFVLLALVYLMQYHMATRKQRSTRDFLLCGIMVGLASWTKYTFVILFLALLLLLLWGAWRWRWNWRQYWFFFLGIALVAPFWLFQNWKFTGNPTYPFLNGIFQSPYWTETANHYFHNALRRWEIQNWDWMTYFTFPFHITLTPRLIDVHTGILPLVFIPLLLRKNSSRGISVLKGYVAASVLIWLLIQTENRSILSTLAVMLAVASVTLQEIEWNRRWHAGAVMTLIGVATAANLFFTLLTTHYLFNPVKYFVGLESKSEYLMRTADSQPAYQYLNTQPGVGRVLLVGLHGPLYLHRPFLFSSFSDPPIAEVLTHEETSPEAIREKLKRLGITHIVLNSIVYERENKEGLYSWIPQQRSHFQRFILEQCRPVVRFGNDRIFAVGRE